MIQGDGISVESLGDIRIMAEKGWVADNLAFGSGGALLQKINRDTQKCAFKCSEITKSDGSRRRSSRTVTDKGKQSKKLTLRWKDGKFTTVTEGKGSAEKDVLVEVFRDGALVEWSFEEVRAAAQAEQQSGSPKGKRAVKFSVDLSDSDLTKPPRGGGCCALQ